ncbi:MAG: LptF/LptG family permease [Thermodesulfovibrionales bacterium]|nr:LptF/LptG family permease [Thermodesulfovibrionales bacterium]
MKIRIYTIHKEMLKELVLTFLLSLIALNFILIMEKILRLSRLLSVVGASLFDMLKIILYLQPPMLILTLPMSLLMSTLLTYGRLNTDNEIVILRASGMTFKGIAAPVFILGMSCFLTGMLVSFYLGPVSMIKLRETISNVITTRAPAAIEEGVFTTLFKDIVLFVKEKPEADRMREIFIYDERNKKEPKVVTAKEGRISAVDGVDIAFYLKDGYMQIARGGSSTEFFFAGYHLSLNLNTEQPARKNSELTPFELWRETNNLSQQQAVPFFLELHRRLSLPSVCLILMLLGPPLSLFAGKSGRLGGLTLGLFIFAVFYVLLIYGENLARSGKISHYIGAWSPTVILGLFSIGVFKREDKK